MADKLPEAPGNDVRTRRLSTQAVVRPVSAPAAAPPLYLMTDAATLGAHLVSEDAVIAGRRAGFYRAVCDAIVLAASLTEQERWHCRPCAAGRRRVER